MTKTSHVSLGKAAELAGLTRSFAQREKKLAADFTDYADKTGIFLFSLVSIREIRVIRG
jgi:hypothetical protein